MPNKKCPNCGFVGVVADYFGYRKVPNKIAQSWCKMCRRGANNIDRTGIVGLPQVKFDTGSSYVIGVDPGRSGGDRTVIAAYKDGEVQKVHEISDEQFYTEHRPQLVEEYCKAYPNDKNNRKRSMNFMVDKLLKKYGSKVTVK